MRNWLIALTVLGATACSQDPMADYPTYVRNATPPHKKIVEKRPPIPQEALVLEMTPGIASFVEGEPGEITFSGRIVGSEEKFDIEIDNLPPGANFDPDSGVMTWTPPNYYVQGDEYFVNTTLKVRLFTRTEPVLMREKEFGVTVYRTFSKPEVIGNTMLDTYREGDNREFKVLVRDPDSSGYWATGSEPVLHIVPSQNSEKDGSIFVGLVPPTSWSPNPIQNAQDNTVWEYRLRMQLRGREITTSVKDLEYGLKATSAYGVPSISTNNSFTVHTLASEPKIDIHDSVFELVEGENFNLHFSVYTESGDGELEVNFGNDCKLSLPGKADCSCKNKSGRTDLKLCKISWTPMNPTRTTYTIPIDAKNTVRLGANPQVRSSRLAPQFKIIPAATTGSGR